MSLATLQSGRGISFDDYFKQALSMNTQKLEAIIRGQDHSLPIVAAMAAYEVKKPMATAAAGQQAQQQLQQAQPTVRQEMEQEMAGPAMIPDMAMLQQQRMGPQPPVLPEQAGVGALPAPNMEGMAMAHGGIIAFDDGGDVPGYAGNEESLVDETSSPIGRFFKNLPFMPQEYSEAAKQKLDAISSERRALGEKLFKLRGPFGTKQQTPQEQAEAEKIQARMNELDKQIIDAKMSGSLETKQQQRERAVRGVTDPNAGKRYKPYPTDVKKPTAVDPTAGQPVTDANASPGFIPPEKLPAPATAAAPAPRATRAPAAPVAAPASAPAPAGETGIAGALKAREALTGGEDKEIREKLGQYEKDVETGIAGLRKIREEGKPTGKTYEKYEAQLMKEEEDAKGKEAKNLQMALVNAGLAIAGGTSRYALENIGKGALVGTKQYMDGIDKLEVAAKKRQEALAMIENARRAEDRGDWEKKNEFESKAMEMQLGAKKSSIDALSKIYDTNKRVATDIFNRLEQDKTAMERTKVEQAGAKERAEIGAAAQRYTADKYSSVRGGNPLALASDDARQEWDSWQKDKMNMLKTPEQKALAQRQIYERVFRNYGLPSPFTAGATPEGGQRKPLAERTDLFQ